MLREVLAISVVLAIASLASNVCAQTAVRNQPQDIKVTSSGESLRGIQSRSIMNDFPRTNNGTSLPASQNSINNNASDSRFLNKLLGGVGDRIEFGSVGDGDLGSQGTPNPFLRDVANGDSDGGVKIRYRLNGK